MTSTELTRQLAVAARVYVFNEEGFEDIWLRYQNLITEEETINQITKSYKHVIKKLKSMKDSESKVYPLRVKEAA